LVQLKLKFVAWNIQFGVPINPALLKFPTHTAIDGLFKPIIDRYLTKFTNSNTMLVFTNNNFTTFQWPRFYHLRSSHLQIFIFQFVNFSTPIFYDDNRFFMAKPKRSFSWTTFSDVLNTEFWLAVILFYLSMTFFIYFEFKFMKVSVCGGMVRSTILRSTSLFDGRF